MAGTARPQGLPAFVATSGGRPALRRGRLASPVVLALRGLHADWEIFAVCDDDGGVVVGLAGLRPRLVFTLRKTSSSVHTEDEIAHEIDFSQGKRGRFCKADVELVVPVFDKGCFRCTAHSHSIAGHPMPASRAVCSSVSTCIDYCGSNDAMR